MIWPETERITLLRLHRPVITTKLDYGSIDRESANKSYIKLLDPIYNQRLEIAPWTFKTYPVESVFVESVYRRSEQLYLQYALELVVVRQILYFW